MIAVEKHANKRAAKAYLASLGYTEAFDDSGDLAIPGCEKNAHGRPLKTANMSRVAGEWLTATPTGEQQ